MSGTTTPVTEAPAGQVTLTVDVAILTIQDGLLCVLLTERAEPQAAWALPGTVLGPGESCPQAAHRALLAHAGVGSLPDGAHLEQLATYSDPDRDPRRRAVSVAYVAFGPRLPGAPAAAAHDVPSARWWPIEELEGPEPVALALDHGRVLADAVERVRAKLEYSTLAAAFLDEPFTLSQLHRVYAAVWGEGPHLPNFRRKVMSTAGFVERVNEHVAATPALFRRGPAQWLQPPLLRPQADPSPPERSGPG